MGKKIRNLFLLFCCGGIFLSINLISFDCLALADDSMNVYVDKNIAFHYPDDLLLKAMNSPPSYSLEKGNSYIYIEIIERNKWEQFKEQYLQSAKNPVTVLDGQSVTLPIKSIIDEYNRNRLAGVIIKTFSADSKRIYFDEMKLFVYRGEKHLYVRCSNINELRNDLLDVILNSVSFPGEDSFIVDFKKGARSIIKASPYAIELRLFNKLGRHSEKRKSWFNVSYQSKPISELQTQAKDNLVNNENVIVEHVKNAIYQYYTEYIYPFYKHEGLIDSLRNPRLNSVDEILLLVDLMEVVIQDQQPNGVVPVGLRFHCSWDEEHGLGLKLIGNRVVAIGFDAVALGDEEGWEGFSHEPSGNQSH